jgi:type II secretory pathway pseudopilin PulG
MPFPMKDSTLALVRRLVLGLFVAGVVFASFVYGYYVAEEGAIKQNYSTEEKARVAYVQIRTLRAALKRYRAEYSRWPCSNAQENLTFSGEEIVPILSGRDPRLNPKGIAFLVGPSARPLEHFLDPWGKPYFVRFTPDTETWSTNGTSTNRSEDGPYIWSSGPGWIKSWEPLPKIYLSPGRDSSDENVKK